MLLGLTERAIKLENEKFQLHTLGTGENGLVNEKDENDMLGNCWQDVKRALKGRTYP